MRHFETAPKQNVEAALHLTERQREIVAHALGRNQHGWRNMTKRPYRNYYCAANGEPELETLVALGAMRHGSLLNEDRDRYYLVTEEGADAIGSKLPYTEAEKEAAERFNTGIRGKRNRARRAKEARHA